MADQAPWQKQTAGAANLGTAVAPAIKYLTTPRAVATTEFIIQPNTAGAAKTVQLPPAAERAGGRMLVVHDYAANAALNNITVTPNGAELLNGAAASLTINTNGALWLLYTDAGAWRAVQLA
jgi:hypothetical protein